MGAKLLREIMETRFHEIQNNFKCASKKMGYTFDYDIFIETFIKCDEKLKNKDVTEEQIIQYFWVAFSNNLKKDFNKRSKISIVDLEEASEVIDEPYDDRRTFIYETMMKHIEANFKPHEVKAWYLHFAENKTYDELVKMGYDNINFHNSFRNINNYIKNQLPRENKNFKNIVNEIFKKKN
jgi:hypothetical protein